MAQSRSDFMDNVQIDILCRATKDSSCDWWLDLCAESCGIECQKSPWWGQKWHPTLIHSLSVTTKPLR